jgi:phytoene dehydrogenase-like protein
VTRHAVVIGSGPNGLVAAIELAKAGFEVEVREAAEEPGGGVRSAELTLPGFVHDVCSAIHPLAVASPALRELDVEWVHPDAPAAHPLDDGTAVVLERSLDETAGSLGADAGAYRTLVESILDAWNDFAGLRFLRAFRRVGPAALRTSLGAATQLAERRFRNERTRALFAGHAAHSMLPLERRPSAGFGVALLAMGHAVGWPFPKGGAGRLAEALVVRLRDLRGEVLTSAPADELPWADLVLADVAPRELLRIAAGRLPPRYARSLARYRHGPGAFKVDWALREPIPWTAPEAGRAGTVHLGGSLDEIAASECAAWEQRPAERPFVLLAQQGRFDPTRGQTAWAYCHVPNGSSEDMTERIEAQVERFAPGFRDLILARNAMAPAALEARNRNLVGGDLNNGAMDLPQLLFRPAARPVPWRTPVEGLYLCSAATPPGGGVHGLCGYFAAKTALRDLERREGVIRVHATRPRGRGLARGG